MHLIPRLSVVAATKVGCCKHELVLHMEAVGTAKRVQEMARQQVEM
jgi:hypothetical protein